MNRLKIVILLISFSLFYIDGKAQFSRIDSSISTNPHNYGYGILPLHQLHVGVQVGSQFTTTSGYGSAFSTFLSPTLTYKVSKRFLLSGGISVVNTSLYGVKPFYSYPSEAPIPGFSGNITQTTLWVSGQYLLSDRITLTGTAYKTVDALGNNPVNSPYYNNNPQGASLRVGYKINDFMHIEAGFGYSRGFNDYSYGNPYGDPFGQGFGTTNYSPYFR